jgi:hypothetical protein
MFKMAIDCEVNVLQGWEPAGYRLATAGDAYLDINTKISAGPTSFPVLILRKRRWKPKSGEKVWLISASSMPYETTFSSLSMRKQYECGLIYRTETEAHEASNALEDTLESMYKKFNYTWQEMLE